jgi:hypothetical protein
MSSDLYWTIPTVHPEQFLRYTLNNSLGGYPEQFPRHPLSDLADSTDSPEFLIRSGKSAESIEIPMIRQ